MVSSSPTQSSSLSPDLAGLLTALLEGDEGAHYVLSDWQAERGGEPVAEPACAADRLDATLKLLPQFVGRELACDFAEHVTPIFERQFPGDQRPRQAIECCRLQMINAVNQQEFDEALERARLSAGGVRGMITPATIENARRLIDLTDTDTQQLRRALPKFTARFAAQIAVLAARGEDCGVIAQRAAEVVGMTLVGRCGGERPNSLRFQLFRAAEHGRRLAWQSTWRVLWKAACEAELDWQTERTLWKLRQAFRG